jgi:chromosome segregation ATPase
MIAFVSCSSKGEYTSIISQFVELNNQMGVPKETVGVIISNVRLTLQKAASTHKNFGRAITTQCNSAQARINGVLKSLGASVTSARNEINSWTRHLSAATRDFKEARAAVAAGKTQLQGLVRQVARVNENYKLYAVEADKKLNVVKILRDIITDELLNNRSRPGALVQVNKFQEKLNELKGLLNNNSDSLYSPMISVLLDLATEQNFSDQAVLRKILQNLNNLNKALLSFRAKQEASLDSEMKTLRSQIRNVKQRVAAYRRMGQQAHSKQIDAQHYIAFYNHEVAHFTAEQGRMNQELQLFNKLCAFEKKVYKNGVAAYKRMVGEVVPSLLNKVQQLGQ